MEIELNNKFDPLFQFLSFNNEINFKSEQPGVSALTTSDKYDIAKKLFTKSPGLFLEKFHKYLKYDCHGDCFESLNSKEEMVIFYLQKLKNLRNENVIKNRRFKKLSQLLTEGNYFSHEQMKEREPLLYERYIDSCISRQEQEAKLGRGYDSFSGFLMNNLLHREDRLRKNVDLVNEESLMPEFDHIDNCDSEEEISDDDNDRNIKVGVDDKMFLEEEFLAIMKGKFMDGEDNFDYSEIDNDSTLDDLEELSRDFEDKYFDEEQPEEIDPVENADQDCGSDDDFIEYNARDTLNKYLSK